jgi:hypothetical protein
MDCKQKTALQKAERLVYSFVVVADRFMIIITIGISEAKTEFSMVTLIA